LRNILWLLIVTLSFNLFSSEITKSDRTKVAILDFSANPSPGADTTSIIEIQTVATLVYEEVRNILKPDYDITTQFQFKSFLKQHGIPESDIITDKAALITAAKALSVKNVIIGNVSMSDKKYLIDIKLVAAEDGKEAFKQFQIDNVGELENEKFKNGLKTFLTEANAPIIKKEIKTTAVVEEEKTIRPYKWHALGTGVAAIASLTAGIIFHTKKLNKEEEHSDKLDSWNPSWSQSEISTFKSDEKTIRGDANSYDSYSKIFYVSAGVLAVTSGVLFFITEEEETEKALSFDFNFDKDFIMLNFKVNLFF